MWPLRETAWRLAAAIRRRRLDRETAAEMRFHLDMETRAGLARGLSAEEARRQARSSQASTRFAMSGASARSTALWPTSDTRAPPCAGSRASR
jgi:hypothetical protein